MIVWQLATNWRIKMVCYSNIFQTWRKQKKEPIVAPCDQLPETKNFRDAYDKTR